MKKDKKGFDTMLISIVIVVALYFFKNLGRYFHWDNELQILFYTCLMGINLIVLCLTFVSKKDMDEILQYNPRNKSEKHKNRKFVKWYKNTIRMEVQGWKFVVIIVITVIGEVSFFIFNRKTDVIAVCDVILDIMTVIGIGSAFVQVHINNTIRQHLEKNR